MGTRFANKKTRVINSPCATVFEFINAGRESCFWPFAMFGGCRVGADTQNLIGYGSSAATPLHQKQAHRAETRREKWEAALGRKLAILGLIIGGLRTFFPSLNRPNTA